MNKVTQPTAAMKHASPKVHEGYWKPDGSAQSTAPKWAKYHTDMASEFPSPYRGTDDPLAHQIEKFVERLDKLRPEKGGPAYLGEERRTGLQVPCRKEREDPREDGRSRRCPR